MGNDFSSVSNSNSTTNMMVQKATEIAQEAQSLRSMGAKNRTYRMNQLVQSIQNIEQSSEIRLGYFLYPILSQNIGITNAQASAPTSSLPEEQQRKNLYQHFCQDQPNKCEDLYQSIALLKQARNDMASTLDGRQFVPTEPQRLRRATGRVGSQ